MGGEGEADQGRGVRYRTIREWGADRLDVLAVRLWDAAHRLRPLYDGPLCHDCRIAPDPGPEAECPTCRDHWEAQKRDEEIYADAYSQGMNDMALRYDPNAP